MFAHVAVVTWLAPFRHWDVPAGHTPVRASASYVKSLGAHTGGDGFASRDASRNGSGEFVWSSRAANRPSRGAGEHRRRSRFPCLGARRELGACPAPMRGGVARQCHAIHRTHLAPDQSLAVTDRAHRANSCAMLSRSTLRSVLTKWAMVVKCGTVMLHHATTVTCSWHTGSIARLRMIPGESAKRTTVRGPWRVLRPEAVPRRDP
ncbi:hypothetical protein [Gemmatimonas sp.]|uniref:hypothetical protein n=1 Tax=Gemmatimonas sp. TaxID=1962908 RepID=UPI00356791CC